MAQPANTGCLKGAIIIALVVIIALVAGVLIVINLTPADVGLADVELFDGETLATLGLADVKFKDFPKMLKEILEPPSESEIVLKPVDKVAEKATATENIGESSVQKKEDGSIDYSSIITDKIVYPTKKNIEYKDTTLAYIFNQMVNDGAESNEDAIKYLQDLNANIDEVSIANTAEGFVLRVVASIDLGTMTAELNDALEEAGVASFIKIPEKAYIVSYQNIAIGEDGLSHTSKSLKINDSDNALTRAIMKILAKKANEAAQEAGENIDTSENVVNDKIGEAFVTVVTNLGKPVSLEDGAIIVETYTAE